MALSSALAAPVSALCAPLCSLRSLPDAALNQRSYCWSSLKQWQHRRQQSHVTCCSYEPESSSNSEPRTFTPDTSSEASTSRAPEVADYSLPVASSESDDTNPLLGLVSVLAAAGALETAYLTWEKFAGETVTCPLGGGSCGDVLNSEYGTLFGLPLSLYGFAAYSATLLLSLLARKDHQDSIWRWVLLGTTSTMAAASGYFMYILNFKLTGYSCTYCVASAVLSVSLLLGSLKGFSGSELRQAAAPQLGLGLGVVLALSLGFSDVRSAMAGSKELDFPPIEPVVTTMSEPRLIGLAKHLKAVGAKMYGAFWCSHCYEQKQFFGSEAMKYVDYVECYPEGYRRGVNIAKACTDAKIEGFPTWIIDGKVLSGEQSFEDLAQASHYTLE